MSKAWVVAGAIMCLPYPLLVYQVGGRTSSYFHLQRWKLLSCPIVMINHFVIDYFIPHHFHHFIIGGKVLVANILTEQGVRVKTSFYRGEYIFLVIFSQ